VRARLHAVVLAAGGASRFGSLKQLARLDGQSLVSRAVSHSRELLGAEVSVVLGAHAARIAASFEAQRTDRAKSAGILVNRGWREGIASSIRLAVRRLSPHCDGVLLVLADQPLVTAAALRRLIHAWRRRPLRIVASQYRGVTGAPAIFPRRCFDELLALRGDSGARSIIRRHAGEVVRIACPQAAIDIDHPRDLLELLRANAQRRTARSPDRPPRHRTQ
jgi:molybdenum cofactor cytidylyltransferase